MNKFRIGVRLGAAFAFSLVVLVVLTVVQLGETRAVHESLDAIAGPRWREIDLAAKAISLAGEDASIASRVFLTVERGGDGAPVRRARGARPAALGDRARRRADRDAVQARREAGVRGRARGTRALRAPAEPGAPAPRRGAAGGRAAARARRGDPGPRRRPRRLAEVPRPRGGPHRRRLEGRPRPLRRGARPLAAPARPHARGDRRHRLLHHAVGHRPARGGGRRGPADRARRPLRGRRGEGLGRGGAAPRRHRGR